MARVQTRRAITVSAAGHQRIAAAAKAAGLSVSGYTEREIIGKLPPLEAPPAPVQAQRRQARGRRR